MEYSEPFNTREKFESAIVVFDTSALCSLYDLQDTYKKTMVDIIDNMKERVWLPAQVLKEYRRNRVKAIKNPITEKYSKPIVPEFVNKGGLLEPIKKYIANQNTKEYHHPFVDDDRLEQLNTLYNQLIHPYREIRNIIKEQTEKRVKEINEIINNDIIEEEIDKLSHGESFPFQVIIEIIKEGDVRYRNHIPPGYEDSGLYHTKKFKGKDGLEQFGDLFIWKEVLIHAKETNKAVIFVSDDMKEDWYEPNGDKEPIYPREELCKEFHDEVNKDFWMYTLHQFANKLITYYKDPQALPLFKDLEEVSFALKNQSTKIIKGDYFVLQCENCNEEFKVYESELNWEWESSGTWERGMGPETEWIDVEQISCPNCDQDIELTIELWEYPTGVLNNVQMSCDGAEIIKEINIASKYIPFYDSIEDLAWLDQNEDEDIPEDEEGNHECVRCGKHTSDLDEHGFCPECHQDYIQFMNAD